MTLFELFGKIVVENEEALKNIEATSEKAKELGDSFEEAGNNADTTSEKLGENSKIGAASVWLGNTLDRVGAAAFNMAKRGVVAGYEYNKMMEGYFTAFSVMLGSGEKAQTLLDELWAFAASTPMEMSGITESAKVLMNYGIAVENVLPTLTLLGNAAMGNQSALDSMVLAYAQAFGKGKFMAEEARQMIGAGFSVYEYLQKVTGQTMEELQALQRTEAGIPFEALYAALLYANQEGERYYNSMDAYAQTIEGREAKLNDELMQALGGIMQPFTDEYKNTVLGKLSEIVGSVNEWTSENSGRLEAWAGGLSDAFIVVTEAAKPLAETLGLILDALALLSGEKVDLKTPQTANPLFTGYSPGIGNKVMELAMRPEMPRLTASGGEIRAWYDSLEPELKESMNLDFPDSSATEAEIEAWWKTVQPSLTATFTINPVIAPGTLGNNEAAMLLLSMGAGGKQLSEHNNENYQLLLSMGADGSHKTGLGFVPRDNYIAKLHQGEAVLTADEAREWRSGKSGRQEVYQEETVISGNTFVIQKEQDIYALAVELNSLKRESRRGRGKRN